MSVNGAGFLGKMPLDNFKRKIEALKRFDLKEQIILIINEYHYYIEGLIRIQLQQGKDSKGNPVTIFGKPFYSDRTVFEKERHGVGLGKQTEFITNYMSGNFYTSLRAITKGSTFEVISYVSYFDDIIRRSGHRIMELSEEHLIEFKSEILIPELQRRFKLLSNGI